jgi:hypothetical protein
MNTRNLTLEQKRFFVGLLEMVCQKLEITETEYQTAEQRYNAVSKWLSDSPVPALANGSIYSQGSIRIQTTVRPIGRNEFDVDLVCHLPGARGMPPSVVRDTVGARLREHGNYREMLKPLNRGWRLDYANEFHMDITPAIDDPGHTNGGVLVPDRELKDWKESNPRGYAVWFEEIAKQGPMFLMEQGFVRADVEPLPDQERFKGTLRRTVQILKRHRDVYFSKKPENQRKDAPISIIITTLAAHAYRDCITANHYNNEMDLLMDVVENMTRYIKVEKAVPPGLPVWIVNPTNSKENFAEKWNAHPERITAFDEWHRAVRSDLDMVAAKQGLDAIGAGLAQMLGDTVSKQLLTEYTTRVNEFRKRSSLGVAASGLIGMAIARPAVAVPKNTFYGE